MDVKVTPSVLYSGLIGVLSPDSEQRRNTMVDEANSVVIARVVVSLRDGTEEIWMVPTRRNGTYYHGVVYLPATAKVISRTHELRPITSSTEIKIDRAELFTAPS
jgi:hypothetical protein